MMTQRSRFFLATTISLLLTSLGSTALANPNSEAVNPHHSDETPVITYDNIGDLLQQAITYESGNFLNNRSISEQFQLIFGIGGVKSDGLSSFPENEITRDSVLLHTIYEDYLQQQAGGDDIRTRDLENPFTTSLGSPDYSED